jgi:uncharacterized Zn-binding protein involved in type VI secretion
MPGIARVGVDAAGGTLLAGGNGNVYVNGALIEVQGGPVQGHGIGPHASPTMVGASGTVYANGIAVCRSGDAASCGHIASGSGDVFAN